MSKKRRVRRNKPKKISDGQSRPLTVVLIWGGAVLFAVFLGLLIGNLLGDAAESVDLSDGAPPIYDYQGEEVKAVNAIYFELKGQNDASFAAYTERIGEGSDISINLNDPSGKMNYRSPTALAVTGDSGATLDLSAAFAALKARGIYISACFYSSIGSFESGSVIEARIEYEASLISEAIDAGADDILIFGLPTDSGGIAYASKLFSRAREKSSGSSHLGVAVSYTRFGIGDAAYALESYGKFSDFLAIDASNVSSLGLTSLAAVEKILYCFERYPLRFIISDSGSANRDVQIKELASIGVYNVQSIARDSISG